MFHHQQKSPLALGLVAGFTLCSPSHRPSNQAPRPQWTKQTCSGFLNRKLTIEVFWWLSLTCLNISCLDEPCFMVSKLLEKNPKLKTWGAQCPHQLVTKCFTKNILLSPMGWWLKPWVLMEWFGCFSSSSGLDVVSSSWGVTILFLYVIQGFFDIFFQMEKVDSKTGQWN